MKNIYCLLAFILLIGSCTDDNPTTPDAKACFNYTPETDIKAGDEISFTSCSEDATNFGWYFGDGDISDEENPVHIYNTGGDYTVKLIVANETSADTVSKTITVGNVGGYFSVNEIKYHLSKGALYFNNVFHAGDPDEIQNEKWHSLWLYHNMDFSLNNDEGVSGIGNLVLLDILSGKSKFNISGNYSNNTGDFDATIEDIANMKNLTIYNGFAALAYDFSGDTFEPEANDIASTYENTDYTNWSMIISNDNSIYTIDISFTVGGKSIKIFYQGELEFYEE